MTRYLHLRQFQASYLDCDQSELWNVFKGMPGGRFYLGGCLGKLCKDMPTEFYENISRNVCPTKILFDWYGDHCQQILWLSDGTSPY